MRSRKDISWKSAEKSAEKVPGFLYAPSWPGLVQIMPYNCPKLLLLLLLLYKMSKLFFKIFQVVNKSCSGSAKNA